MNELKLLNLQLQSLEEKLEYFCTIVKYQTFDIEATKRERDRYLEIIKKHGLGDEL